MTVAEDNDVVSAEVALLDAPRQLRWQRERLEAAQLAPGSLLAQSEVSVISPGTELAAYVGAPPLRAAVTYPRLLGYCNVARVLRCSAQVREVKVGDRILTFQSHRSHFVIPQGDVLAVVQPELSSQDAACAYLFHLGYSANLEADVRLGSTVVVIGLGVLGITALACAVRAGARVIAVSDQLHAHALAAELGAARCFTRRDCGELYELLGADGANAVINTSNTWADWQIGLAAAGQRSSIAVLGFPGRQEPAIPANPLDSRYFYAKQLRILAVGAMPERSDSRGFLPFNERANLARILGWLAEGRFRAQWLLSGEYRGQDLALAYAALLERRGTALTYALRWGTL